MINNSLLPVGISIIDAMNDTTVQNEYAANIVIQLSLSNKELIAGQVNGPFYTTILKLINEEKVSSDSYFLNWIKVWEVMIKILYTSSTKDVDTHIKQCVKCRQQNLHP